jgi:hypothetical protein
MIVGESSAAKRVIRSASRVNRHHQVRAAGIGSQGRSDAGSLGKQVADLLHSAFEPGRMDVLRQHRRRNFEGDDQSGLIVGKWRRLALPRWTGQ